MRIRFGRVGSVAVVITLTMICSAVLPVANAGAGTTPLTLMRTALANAVAKRYVTASSIETFPNPSGPLKVQSILEITHAGPNGGMQLYRTTIGGVNHDEVIKLVRGVGYIKADRTALIADGMSVKVSSQLAGKWFVMTDAGNHSDFAFYTYALTIGQQIGQMAIAVPVRTGTSIVRGVSTVALRGTVPANQVNQAFREALYVSDTSSTLPIEAVIFPPSGDPPSTTTFSDWGRAFSLVAPRATMELDAGGRIIRYVGT